MVTPIGLGTMELGGGGGGKPALAMGGGTDSSRIPDALVHGLELVKEGCKQVCR